MTNDNAIRWYMSRQNRKAPQVAMLAVGVLAMEAALWFGATLVTSMSELYLWITVRWALGEFFWCWMAADHLFTSFGRLRKTGQLEEWMTTEHSPREIVRGVTDSTFWFLAMGVLVSLACDYAIFVYEFGEIVAREPGALKVAFSMLPLDFLMVGTVGRDAAIGMGAAALVMFLILAAHASLLATVRMAVAKCARNALQREASTLTWAGTLVKLGVFLALLATAMILLLWVSTFAPGIDSLGVVHLKNPETMLGGWIERARVNFYVLMAGLLVVILGLPILVKTMVARRDLEKAVERLENLEPVRGN